MNIILYIIISAVTLGVTVAVFIFTGRIKNNKAAIKAACFGIRAFMVCTVLEVMIFNLNAIHLAGGSYKEHELDLLEAVTENGENRIIYEFTDMNEPVGTLNFDAVSASGGQINVTIDMADDTNAAYRVGIAKAQILSGYQRTGTVPCNFSGNVHKLRITISTDDKAELAVRAITVNKPVAFCFSFVRVGIIWLVAMAVYFMTGSGFYAGNYADGRTLVKRSAYVMTFFLIGIALWMTNSCRYANPEHDFWSDFCCENGNQITEELVNAFEKGHVYLDREVNEKLTGLDNPYDWSQRTKEIGSYPWDHLLYEGKYYSYYGIAPLLIFIPYHLATGFYFPSVWAIWLFGCVGIYFLTRTYLCIADKYWGRVRSSLVMMGLFMMQLASGIWFTFNKANFYEIAQNGGFACVTAGAYFLISSNVIGDENIKRGRLVWAAVFLSLAVLCRPTLALYCIAALFFIGAGFVKLRKSGDKKYISYWICALVPFAVIGGIQMAYNYARFGSFFDFGIQYSLTINDFTKSQYHTHFVGIGLWNYLFAFPSFSQNYPFFIPSSVDTFNPNGYYFVATHNAVGLVWKALPLMAYALSLKAYRKAPAGSRRVGTVLLAASSVIAPLIIICSIWESGYGARYCVDFAWEMLMGALIISFIIWQNASANTKKHLNSVMAAACILCLVLTFSQTVSWILDGDLSNGWRMSMLNFGRLFEFWR